MSVQETQGANSLVSGDVRRHNLSMLVKHLALHGGTSRSNLATETGLTKGSVTALSSLLIESGLLRETSTQGNSGKGRPSTLLEITADSKAILVLQLDAEKVTGLLTTLIGKPLVRLTQYHGRPMGQPGPILDVMAQVLTQLLLACEEANREVAAMTVVVFAPVGGDPRIVIADTDLDWEAIDLLGGLRERVPNMPSNAVLEPDSILAALAELSQLDGVRDMIYLKSNSGIGGALVVDGQVVVGANQLAAALGHVPVVPNGIKCACGQHGCLVTVAGPDALLEAAGMQDLAQSDGLTIALDEFVERVERGEDAATRAWVTAMDWISRTLQILTVVTDPQVVVLGGYWSRLAGAVAAHFDATRPMATDGTKWLAPQVLSGKLGADAALLGAVWSARDALIEDPINI